MYQKKYLRPDTVAAITSRIKKKHPNYFYLSVSDSEHCVLGYTVDVFIELEDEDIHYATDKAGRLRVCKRTILTPTYKSIRQQPLDSVVVVLEGRYKGQFICGGGHDGWYDTTTDINKVKLMRESYAIEARNRIAFNAQYCYGRKFEVIKINH